MTDDDLRLDTNEREIIRREFMTRFHDAPSIHEGFRVKRWVTGPLKGTPKLTAAVQGMLSRGLVAIEGDGYWPRVRFTERGLQALKLMAADRRALDTERYRQLLDELQHLPMTNPSVPGAQSQ